METTLTTIRRVARQLGVPTLWLKTEIDAGRIPHLRAGRRILLDPKAVARALCQRAGTLPAQVSQST